MFLAAGMLNIAHFERSADGKPSLWVYFLFLTIVSKEDIFGHHDSGTIFKSVMASVGPSSPTLQPYRFLILKIGCGESSTGIDGNGNSVGRQIDGVC